jgi:hypothetical protein
MTTKTTKQVKNVLAITEHGARGSLLAGLHLKGLSISEAISEVCMDEYKANQKEGRKCGTIRSGDEFMIATRNALIESGRYTEGCKTLKNIMSNVRKAVNLGAAYSHNNGSDNGSDKAKTGKASKSRGARQSVGEKSVVKLTIVKDAQAYDVAEGLREAINSEKFRESYAELAAFLTDALNEFQGQ